MLLERPIRRCSLATRVSGESLGLSGRFRVFWGSTRAAHLALIVWCKDCRQQVEPDVAEQVERYGAGLTLLD